MRYYAYLGNPDLGIKMLQDFSSRGFLTYLIYFIFSTILYSAARNIHIMKREWYSRKLKALLDIGVDCFKTDFGERIPTDVVYFDGSNPI
jgi:hypothetical protein